MNTSLAHHHATSRVDLQIGSDRIQRLVETDNQPKARVALVRAPLLFAEGAIGNEIVPSIGLAYLNGYLRKFGYEPLLFDGQGDHHNQVSPVSQYPGYQIQGIPIDQLVRRMPADIAIFGVSAMFTAEWPLTRDLINAIRARFPEAVIVAGGEHVSAAPEYCLRDCPALDYCVLGEGEHILLELCEALTHQRTIEHIPGLAYLNDDQQFITNSGVTRIRDIDQIPWPYWPEGYLEKFWESGKSFGVKTARDMPILMTRGCPYQCTFCSNSDMWTTRYVLRSIDDIIAEIQFFYEKYQVTSFQIYDLTAITKKKWFMELLERIIELQLPVEWSFPSGTRSEILDRDILTLLKKIGTSYLCYAPESGSKKTLEAIKKRVDLDKMMDSMREAKKAGLNIRANFIIGFPNETRRDIFKTFWLTLRCAVLGVDDLQPYLFNPYPGSQLFRDCLANEHIALSDDYFLSISNQNSDILNFRPVTFNHAIPNWELACYRLLMTVACYSVGYLLHPRRIIRTLGNLISNKRSDTVLESRLQGMASRKSSSHSA